MFLPDDSTTRNPHPDDGHTRMKGALRLSLGVALAVLLLWLAALLTCANSFYYRINMAKAPPLTKGGWKDNVNVVNIYIR